jgi:hypothetical protein
MRIVWIPLLLVCLSVPQVARAEEETRIGGVRFGLGFESYPGRLHYRLDGFRYLNGTLRDVKHQPTSEDIAFGAFSLRATGLVQTGFPHLWAGLEVGISLPISWYRKSWNVPALAPKLTRDYYFPSFC